MSTDGGMLRATKPLGGFFSMCLDTVWSLRKGMNVTEFLEQVAFLLRVSIIPTVLIAVPLTTNVTFLGNRLLGELGATDLGGAGAFLGSVREIGPIATVLVIAGAGATAVAADLGSRTIRSEVDAMDVLGVDPVHRLVLPRVAAMFVVALILNPIVASTGIIGGYLFSVFAQDATPGLFIDSLTLLSKGSIEILFSQIKAGTFGLLAGFVGCHRGLTAKGGPSGVGNAVNQTVVISFVLLFVANTLITSIFVQITT